MFILRLVPAMILVLAGPVVRFAGDDKAKKPLQDAERILGVWTMVKGEVGDHPITDANGPLDEWTFDKDTVTAKRRGKTFFKDRLNYVLDPKANPRTIDLEFNGKKIFLGIYEFQGDRLRICYNLKRRPRRFASDEDTDPRNVLLEFEKK